MSVRGRVAEAMTSVTRADFLPADLREHAAEDVPLRIGHGATNSQPSTVAAMLELLDPRPGDRVLDVGAGSGWTTALLAHLVGAGGQVLGVELVPELATAAADLLARRGVGTATVETARVDVLGAPGRGPFDRILVSAMARAVPDELVDQLADGGRLVVPVQGRMLVVDRSGQHVTTTTAPGYYRFVPLR
ncbi:protein-L-isoaspartate O-methyltransferase [Ornithinimicrobium tianjinense]|uniref:Protein-L-isoaspartate O-methyltransferase n=2 Tax=Ornithinimicrobium tianjinense TaxID=1195761 RepID=A0A917F7G6_9MICO|nr:methyltransferase domain-containing protein [Ornithinimicrobium tianjinense]GGF53380.1 fibrillarin-like rRNA methylase [Ornithinimicrobium tianjinense]